ncbi:hypothetical protein WCE10_21460 [Cronobacter muytjensii]|uniref:hypothetical protein n=1 Tax=Cronobacter muytjensii TaxID=413501 RepID=UPI0034D4A053
MTESAARLAGASCEAITDELARLVALELTVEEFGDLLDDARSALETTASALCELRDAAEAREAARE